LGPKSSILLSQYLASRVAASYILQCGCNETHDWSEFHIRNQNHRCIMFKGMYLSFTQVNSSQLKSSQLTVEDSQSCSLDMITNTPAGRTDVHNHSFLTTENKDPLFNRTSPESREFAICASSHSLDSIQLN
jgi:hypothetical protein